MDIGGPAPEPTTRLLPLHRATQRALLVGILLLLPFAAGATAGAIDPDRWLVDGSGTTERVIAGFFAVFFDLLLLLFVLALPKVRKQLLGFDAAGVWWLHGEAWTLLRWDEVARVGLAWSVKPTLNLWRNKYFSVEIYPKDPARALAGRDLDERPSFEGLPSGPHWHVDLPPLTSYARRVERAVQRIRPEVWAGRRRIEHVGVLRTLASSRK
jgi:hypothetical protein